MKTQYKVTQIDPNRIGFYEGYGRFEDRPFYGNFGWKYQGAQHDGQLYCLDSFDKDYTQTVPLKHGEVLLRYCTDRMKHGLPLVKLDVELGIVYFLTADSYNGLNGDDVQFEGRGCKLVYLNIVKGYWFAP